MSIQTATPADRFGPLERPVMGVVGQPFRLGANSWPRGRAMSWWAEGRLD